MTRNRVRLGDLTRIKTGKLDANAASENGVYPFFTCSEEPLAIDTYSYDAECVLVAGNGNLNVKYYNGKFDAYQRTYIVESSDTGVLNTRYLYHFLDTYVDELRKLAIGGIIKYIKLGNLTDALIPLPLLGEQARVAKLLDSVDEVIRLRNYHLDQLEVLVKSRFVEMFGDCQIRNTIGESGLIISDGNYSSKYPRKEDFVDQGVPFIRAKTSLMEQYSMKTYCSSLKRSIRS